MTNEDMIEILGGIRACYNIFNERDRSKYHALSIAIEALKRQKHGHWINHFDDLFPEESTQECSVCHAEQMGTMLNDNFCPNCGAKMDEVREDV